MAPPARTAGSMRDTIEAAFNAKVVVNAYVDRDFNVDFIAKVEHMSEKHGSTIGTLDGRGRTVPQAMRALWHELTDQRFANNDPYRFIVIDPPGEGRRGEIVRRSFRYEKEVGRWTQFDTVHRT